MKLSGEKDLRVVKTEEAIRKSFEELLCEKDYLEITVTELCERAGISKKRRFPSFDPWIVNNM